MGGAEKVSDFPAPTRPTINLPPRASFDSLFFGVSGFSPGPMTLVSNLFSPDSNHRSFSQLLAGAMASPVAAPNSQDYSSKQVTSGDGSEENLGFKQNRPMSLVVPSSPMFMMSPGLLSSPGFFSPLQSPFGMSHQQALAHVTAQAALSQSYQAPLLPSSADSLEQNPSALYVGVGQHMDAIETAQGNSKMEPPGVSQSARKLSSTSSTIDKPVDDGYNWRKYGQKQVKASEYPRSYYKCTHVNCLVKKKIEHSLEGCITEIIYKGQHNHEPPCSNKHPKDGGNVSCTSELQVNSEIVQNQTQIGRLDDGFPSHSVCCKDQDSTHDCADNDEIVLNEGDDCEPNRKRRNMGIAKSEASSSHKTVMESKIIVQTQSEVDLLDDGYKWRKYGQKVVKGNPHPRSYYRCTFVGCNVRKHVERASTDKKSVVTTYEGKHNHDAPAVKRCRQNSRNGSHSKLPKVVSAKPAPHEEMGIGSQDPRPVLYG